MMRGYRSSDCKEIRNECSMKKQIIFDMDGVIFDTENLILNCWRFLAEKYDIPQIEDTFRRAIGVSSEGTKKIVREVYGEDFPCEMFWKEWKQLFDQKIEKQGLPVKQGARELLSFLKINGFRVGLASSTRYESVVDELTQAGLIDFFEILVGGDMVERGKPEPDIYLCACEKMGIDPKETFAIEDSWNGVRSAAGAGLRVLHVPDLLEPNEEMERLSYAIFDDLIDVRNYLAKQK